MKLIRGLFYATVGLTVGLILKRFLTEDAPKPATAPAPFSATPATKPSPKPPAKADADGEEIAVVDLDASPADDLTHINGIGATYAKRLREAGIKTFAQLAARDVAELRQIAQIKEWQVADPADWIAEAKNLINE